MLRHIVLDDLQDTARLLVLFEQAHTQGLIGNSNSERLTFVAAAEHARVMGSRNPCGLFAELIRRQRWDYVTDSDEDAAYRRLKHHLYGPDLPAGGTSPRDDSASRALERRRYRVSSANGARPGRVSWGCV